MRQQNMFLIVFPICFFALSFTSNFFKPPPPQNSNNWPLNFQVKYKDKIKITCPTLATGNRRGLEQGLTSFSLYVIDTTNRKFELSTYNSRNSKTKNNKSICSYTDYDKPSFEWKWLYTCNLRKQNSMGLNPDEYHFTVGNSIIPGTNAYVVGHNYTIIAAENTARKQTDEGMDIDITDENEIYTLPYHSTLCSDKQHAFSFQVMRNDNIGNNPTEPESNSPKIIPDELPITDADDYDVNFGPVDKTKTEQSGLNAFNWSNAPKIFKVMVVVVLTTISIIFLLILILLLRKTCCNYKKSDHRNREAPTSGNVPFLQPNSFETNSRTPTDADSYTNRGTLSGNMTMDTSDNSAKNTNQLNENGVVVVDNNFKYLSNTNLLKELKMPVKAEVPVHISREELREVITVPERQKFLSTQQFGNHNHNNQNNTSILQHYTVGNHHHHHQRKNTFTSVNDQSIINPQPGKTNNLNFNGPRPVVALDSDESHIMLGCNTVTEF